jgi:hypothetical protein
MVLQRYFMLTFTWIIRNFAGGNMSRQEILENLERENRGN